MTGLIVLMLIAVAVAVAAGTAQQRRRRPARHGRAARWGALLGRAGSAVPFHAVDWDKEAPTAVGEERRPQ